MCEEGQGNQEVEILREMRESDLPGCSVREIQSRPIRNEVLRCTMAQKIQSNGVVGGKLNNRRRAGFEVAVASIGDTLTAAGKTD